MLIVYYMYHSNDYFYSFPSDWIKGNTHPRGIPYNTVLSKYDKILIEQLYGSPGSRAVDAGDK